MISVEYQQKVLKYSVQLIEKCGPVWKWLLYSKGRRDELLFDTKIKRLFMLVDLDMSWQLVEMLEEELSLICSG